jgi:hypothetical protein
MLNTKNLFGPARAFKVTMVQVQVQVLITSFIKTAAVAQAAQPEAHWQAAPGPRQLEQLLIS